MPQEKDSSLKTISVVMALTLVGKVLGLLRDRLLAINYGVGIEASAFLTASRIPRVFFDVIFASAIAACFIPVFSQALSKRGRDHAFGVAGSFLTLVTLFAAALTLAGMVFARPLSALMLDTENLVALELTTRLTRLLFPTALFTAVAFSFVGILQSMDEFRVPALISTVSNLVVIAYYFSLNEQYGIFGLAGAFLLGWFLQAGIQVPALGRLGFRFRPGLGRGLPEMGQIFRLMPPVMVSTWVLPINLTINARYGWRLYDGAGVTAIELSSNLYQIIAGVFILSVTNVIFPKLSLLTAQNREGEFQSTLAGALRGTLYLVFPMTAGLMLVSRPLIDLVYGGGAFDAFSVDITAQGLFWVSLGMAGYALQNILSRAYFARQEGRVPLIAGAVSIGVNLALCMLLTDRMGIRGLAIASAVSSTVYGLLLLAPLLGRYPGLKSRALWGALGRMLVAAAGMIPPCLWVGSLAQGLAPGKGGLALQLCAVAGAGCLCYLLLTRLLRLEEINMVRTLLLRIRKRG